MNPEQPQNYDDEIKLTDIIRFIWDGKWIISGVTAVTTIIAVLYLINTTKIYQATLEIFPISSIESAKYEELNNSKKSLKFYNEGAHSDTTKKIDNGFIDNGFIDSKKLELLFLQDLQTYKSFEASIMENMYLEKMKDETELDFLDRIKKAARGFKLSKLENKKAADTLKQPATLTVFFKTVKPDLALKVISDALVFSNNNVNMQLERDLDRRLKSHARRVETELEDIKITSKNLVDHEKIRT
jgi:LPS O-antigen subunit length determinant protein (WzzB/FepE family)